jgi:hypothetical protein
VHIVLKGTAPNGVDLIAIGYRYSTKTTLFFVATADAGSTRPGKEYEMKYTDSNTIDKHNQAQQFDLALEKTWPTQDPYFRLSCILIGINVVDTLKLANYHILLNAPGTKEDSKMSIKRFAGILCHQLVTNTSAFTSASLRQSGMCSEISMPSKPILNTQDISDVTTNTENKEDFHVPIRSLKDNNGLLHHQVRYHVSVSKAGKRSTLTRECKLCKELGKKTHLVGYYCM